ncbi:MAG: trans-sulfuration enzyme family protein [Anaplasma sp.]
MKSQVEHHEIPTEGMNHRAAVGMLPPVHRRSTVPFKSVREIVNAYGGYCGTESRTTGIDASYGNAASDSYTHLARDIGAMDGGAHVLLYPSGLSCLVMLCIAFSEVGSHILIPKQAYFKLRRFIRESLPKLGRSFSIYESAKDVSTLANEKTSLIMVETLSSTKLVLEDIAPITEFAKKRNIVTVCDNSCIPVVLNPLEHGADITMYSLTKYFGGHSDVMMGASITNDVKIFERLYKEYRNYGLCVSSDDCYLVHRGMKTMGVRMMRAQSTAIAFANRLKNHERVAQVVYPGLPSYPQREIWEKYCKGMYGLGLVNLIFDQNYSVEAVDYMLEDIKIFKIGLSWGGCKSIVLPIAQGSLMNAVQAGVDGIRVYCGLEDQEEVIASMEEALSRLSFPPPTANA